MGSQHSMKATDSSLKKSPTKGENLFRTKLRKKRKTFPKERDLSPLFALEGSILSFAPFDHEIDIWPLNHHLASEKRLLLPKVVGNELHIYWVENLEELLHSDWGIQEPDPQKCQRAAFEEISLVLVPGLAFDENFHRIGYGKGYYDRLLPKLLKAKKIGVGYQEQLHPTPFHPKSSDYPLDELILLCMSGKSAPNAVSMDLFYTHSSSRLGN